MAQGAASEVTRGALGLNDELSDFRALGIDSAKMFMLFAGDVPFLSALLTKKMGKRSVDSYKFVSFEQAEETVYLTAASAAGGAIPASSTASYATCAILDAHAKQLQAGQFLSNHSINVDVSAGFTRPTITTVVQPDIGVVIDVGLAGSAIAGYTSVVVERLPSWSGNGYATTNFATIFWTVGDVIARDNFANYDSEGTKNPVQLNPAKLTSYLQDFRKPFGVTEREQEERKFVVRDPIEWAGKKARWEFFRSVERTFLFDGWGAETSTAGLNTTSTLSINSIIPSANRKSITTLGKAAYDTALATFSQKGQSGDTRIIVASQTHLYKVNTLFQSYLRDEPFAGKKDFGYTVPTYTDPLGVKYQFMYSREMSETSWLADSAYVINMNYVNYAYLQGTSRSFDFYVDMGQNGKGLQSNDAKKTIYELRSVCGLDVNYYSAHGQIRFV